MCGIVGIFPHDSQRPVDRSLLNRMNEALYHRGPDDGGLHLEPGVGLGHRRLSIIDVGGGHQPLFNEDGTVAVVFNGEIYNYRELLPELIRLGHTFRTKTDTEVIVHAWEQWGEACVQRFRGMFAFGLWDRNRRTLFLARDRVGIKPLYYALLPDGTLTFASELKALLLHPGLPRDVVPASVADYFAYGYVPEPRTIYKHVHKLPPAHTFTIQQGQRLPTLRSYWDLIFYNESDESETTAADELQTRLRESVNSHLVADVPVGAFLSGGVDSSAVVASMAGLTTRPVHTASISFGETAFDEAEHAAAVARRYATDHHVRRVDPDDFSLVERLTGLYDEPYADSSAMPTYRVSELAREGVKVVLSGDGGDEAFAGYRRYRHQLHEERVRRLLPLGLRRFSFGLAGRCYPKMDWAPRPLRAKATFEILAHGSVEGYFHSVSIVGEAQAKRLFSEAFHRELNGYRPIEVLQRHARSAPHDPLSKVQYLDFKTYLPGDILTKVDRASMAHSLEVRVPLLDHHFLEWAATVPPSLRLRGGEGKYIFKRALEPRLPRDILYRPKQGFAVPLAGWFRGPLRERVEAALLGERLADTGWFDQRYLKQVVQDHGAGLRDHSALIWSLLMFEKTLRSSETGDTANHIAAAGGLA